MMTKCVLGESLWCLWHYGGTAFSGYYVVVAVAIVLMHLLF
jgi:hypothetical protein